MNVARNGKKILIVEDQNVLAEMYKAKFEMCGYETLIAYDGMDAIAKLPEFLPNAVLLDLMMPEMDGFETLRVIRDLAPSLHMKIVVFSNLDDANSIEKCRNLGADDFVVKVTATPRSLMERIERHLSEEETVRRSLRFWGMGKDEAIPNCSIEFAGKSLIGKIIRTCPHCGKDAEFELGEGDFAPS